MCGRYTLKTEQTLWEERFGCDATNVIYQPSYNIAPGQDIVAVVGTDTGPLAGLLRWGLVPSWAKDVKVGYRMINARAETAAEKPSFRRALRQRRCLILADGYYEWRREGKQKTPMYIQLRSREPFAFAGLWERWQNPEATDAPPLSTCTVLTTTANTALQPIHPRMPVMLSREAERLWLDRDVTDPEMLLPVLIPAPPESIEVYEVAPTVNAARNNSPDCIVPVISP